LDKNVNIDIILTVLAQDDLARVATVLHKTTFGNTTILSRDIRPLPGTPHTWKICAICEGNHPDPSSPPCLPKRIILIPKNPKTSQATKGVANKLKDTYPDIANVGLDNTSLGLSDKTRGKFIFLLLKTGEALKEVYKDIHTNKHDLQQKIRKSFTLIVPFDLPTCNQTHCPFVTGHWKNECPITAEAWKTILSKPSPVLDSIPDDLDCAHENNITNDDTVEKKNPALLCLLLTHIGYCNNNCPTHEKLQQNAMAWAKGVVMKTKKTQHHLTKHPLAETGRSPQWTPTATVALLPPGVDYTSLLLLNPTQALDITGSGRIFAPNDEPFQNCHPLEAVMRSKALGSSDLNNLKDPDFDATSQVTKHAASAAMSLMKPWDTPTATLTAIATLTETPFIAIDATSDPRGRVSIRYGFITPAGDNKSYPSSVPVILVHSWTKP
jgi:hypothetical protein